MVLEGKTYDGTGIDGQDSIRIVPQERRIGGPKRSYAPSRRESVEVARLRWIGVSAPVPG